jgi:plasmid maintenance system antidote protein VapI
MKTMTRQRRPTSPGEILREEFLIPLGLTHCRVPRNSVSACSPFSVAV